MMQVRCFWPLATVIVFQDNSAGGILRTLIHQCTPATKQLGLSFILTGLFVDGPAAELHLKSGTVLKGTSFGAHGVEMTGELVFNTGELCGQFE